MNYRIIWKPAAEQDLAAIWLGAADRRVVTSASAELESSLGMIPLRIGESRESSVRRVAICRPLGVAYEVIEDDKKVVVQFAFAVS